MTGHNFNNYDNQRTEKSSRVEQYTPKESSKVT